MATVFLQFLLLGCISFGGPVAHIGYFRHRFVDQLKWLNDQHYTQLVSLSQFLPGPGSSQVGFAIGYHRAGLLGGIAAFLGFTLPSFVLLLLLAFGSQDFFDDVVFQNVLHGLKLLAVVVVADAVLGMFKSFCKTVKAVVLCFAVTVILLVIPGLLTQLVLLFIAALIGSLFFSVTGQSRFNDKEKIRLLPFVLFIVLLVGLPFLAGHHYFIDLFAQFYQAGSLVFGGGHVVLPLLQGLVGDALTTDQFLLGYAAAQAVPGPMFSMSAYLGYELLPQSPWLGALIATLAIFLPGFLLVIGFQNVWQSVASQRYVAGAVAAVNAAVVGLLLAVLYQPVFISAVHSIYDVLFVILGFCLLRFGKLKLIWLVMVFLCIGYLQSFIT